MNTHQKALLVITRPHETQGLDELNIALHRGWRVVHATAMGGAGTGVENDVPALCFAALVIIERGEDATAELLEQVEERHHDLLNDVAGAYSASLEREGY
jgi:hypothetical protein